MNRELVNHFFIGNLLRIDSSKHGSAPWPQSPAPVSLAKYVPFQSMPVHASPVHASPLKSSLIELEFSDSSFNDFLMIRLHELFEVKIKLVRDIGPEIKRNRIE